MNRKTQLSLTVLGLLLAVIASTVTAQRDVTPSPTSQEETPTAKTYQIDSVHSTALFRIQHLGAGQFWGRFNDVTGTFTHAEGMEPTFDVSIAIDSIDTNNDKLNSHLKSPDFFDAKEYPTMSFKSTALREVSADNWALTGDLTIHGVTKPITARLVHTGTASLAGPERAGFEATFIVKRGDFGVNYGLDNGMLGKDVQVTIALEGIKQ